LQEAAETLVQVQVPAHQLSQSHLKEIIMATPKAKGRTKAAPKGEVAPKSEAKTHDWESIEAVYRAGIISVKTIAAHHGLSDTAIHKRAKAEGWQRNLAAKVRKAAQAKLVCEDGLRDGLQTQTDNQIVENAAEVLVTVTRDHRKTVKRGRDIALKLFDQLSEAIDHRGEIEEDIELETADDKDGKRRSRMMRAVSLGTHAAIMLNLSAAIKNIIALERIAFNMDEAGSGEEGEERTVIVLPSNGRV
jgi:hypothetical protein